MPLISRTLLLALAALIAAPAVAAQGGAFMPYLGYELANERAVVGVGFRSPFPLPSPIRVIAQPAIEVQLVDEAGDVTLLQGDLNVVAELPGLAAAPYVGAGIALLYYNDDLGNSDTEVGLNLLAGVVLNPIGFAQPFAQARYTVFDGSDAVTVMGGIALGI